MMEVRLLSDLVAHGHPCVGGLPPGPHPAAHVVAPDGTLWCPTCGAVKSAGGMWLEPWWKSYVEKPT